MIVFELTMPHRGSWNNHWSGENDRHIIVRRKDKDIDYTNLIGRNFYYSWPDGWTACVSVSECNSREAKRLQKQSTGFCGYNWMVYSILEYGEIRIPKEI